MPVEDIYTKSLLHFNGTDTSTTFTDESGKAWTAHGSAQIDTAQSVFGGAAGLFTAATSDYVDTPDSDDWNLGTLDFTVDFWLRRTSTSIYHGVFSQFVDSNNNVSFAFDNSNILYFIAVKSGTTIGRFYCTAANHGMSAGTWYHVAVVLASGTPYLFVGGSSKTISVSTSFSGKTMPDIAGTFRIGWAYSDGARYLNGWVDEFRFSKGIARWVTTFTPPTHEYGAGGGIQAIWM